MWKAQFTRNKLTFEHENNEDFEICFLQKKVTMTWIVYRCLLILFTSLFLIVTYSLPINDVVWYKNFLYVDHWVCYSGITCFTLALIISVRRYKSDKRLNFDENRETGKIPAMYKTMWFLYVITAPVAITFTAMFWIFIYDTEFNKSLIHILLSHCLIGVCALIDIILNGVPFQFYHCYVPAAFGTVYVLFTCFYQLCGGTANYNQVPIYSLMDWRKPGYAFLTGFLYMVATIFTHLALCVLYTTKLSLRRRREEAQED